METQVSDRKEITEETLPAPGGIGMAVAVDWGLTVQVGLTLIFSLINGMSGHAKMMNIPVLALPLVSVLFFVVGLIFAVALASPPS